MATPQTNQNRNLRRLVIVESPTKAKTIRRFLPGNSYKIEASMGHVRDLPASADEIPENLKKQDWARIGVNIEKDFEPLYIVSPDKKKVVSKLKDALKDADEVYIATDEDREGESIGWHLLEVLKPKVPVKRMVFHEITQDAILEALNNTRDIDRNLVDAQETRRVLDRLVGYTISPLLWKKVAPKLSAGRVQSVAVRLMVTREKERIAFVPASYWDLTAKLAKEKSNFEATMTHLAGVRLATGRDFEDTTGQLKPGLTAGKDLVLLPQDRAKALAESLIKQPFKVLELEERLANRSPNAPFTTSTLQQEANRKLGLSARDTMRLAQSLYENGYITYMRTDSTHLSKEAIDASRRAVVNRYGSEYLFERVRQYDTKSKNAQEAHEAIRPAGKDMKTREEQGLSGREGDLYDLIWKRTIATQMAEAKLRFVTATIEAGQGDDRGTFRATGRTTIFPGFFRAYVEGSDDPDAALDDREQPLPALSKGDGLDCKNLDAVGHETKPPARFTEASLVKMLESEGIGRPSTYASIIDTVIRRGYVRKQGNQLIPTFTAFATNNLMEKQFDSLVDTHFTANMEQKLDDISNGELKAAPYLKHFYFGNEGLEVQVKGGLDIDAREMSTISFPKWGKPVVRVGKFGPYVESEIDGERKTSSLPIDTSPGDLTEKYLLELLAGTAKGDTVLGNHPDTGEEMTVRQGPYGPYIQMGEGEKPKRVSLPKGMDPASVTFEAALGLTALPREIGLHPETGQKITANVGRFGPYVQHGKTFASLGKQDDVLAVTLERALSLIAIKEGKSRALKVVGQHPETKEDIEVLDGKYGPYVKHQKINASLQKGQTPESITLDEALKLLAEREANMPAKAKAKAKVDSKSKKSTAKKSASKSKAPAGPKATSKDLEPFLNDLDDTAKNVVMRVEGMKGQAKKDIVAVTDELGLSQEDVEKAYKRGMFKLRIAFGKARKDVKEAA
jgi:DNA topoisomerase I